MATALSLSSDEKIEPGIGLGQFLAPLAIVLAVLLLVGNRTPEASPAASGCLQQFRWAQPDATDQLRFSVDFCEAQADPRNLFVTLRFYLENGNQYLLSFDGATRQQSLWLTQQGWGAPAHGPVLLREGLAEPEPAAPGGIGWTLPLEALGEIPANRQLRFVFVESFEAKPVSLSELLAARPVIDRIQVGDLRLANGMAS